MQKNVLKHQFENFSTASNESLDKAYDRFQKLISQLEVHGALISKEDINQKFLRSLPFSWNQISLIMRNKPDIDDLYNNLRVYEDELKSTNEVSTASGDFGVSTAGGINQVPSTPCAHDVAYSFLHNQQPVLNLRMRIFSRWMENDLEELDLRCRLYGLEGYDWSNEFEVEPVNYCFDGNLHFQVLLTVRGYEIALESLESRILGHEKNELAWGKKYEFQNYKLKCREIKINNLNMELEKVVKERDGLKDKIAKWKESSKNLDEILNIK
ncbi:hypothetical protein Tco_0679639 [Tanacetum coccineum]|uniref:Uncharacterized protein n=1 Tax=Tanacetum coccineum TaxID=301880 RepID=A0ABQ4XJ54_9ASTR